jgi:peptide/nickel transport system ATP-binding protein
MSENGAEVLLEVRSLKTYFHLEEGLVRAVDDVSFDLKKGRVTGIVGESGCGKSVTGQSILRIVPPPGRTEGQILWHRLDPEHPGSEQVVDLIDLDPKGNEIRSIRGGEIGIVFQEPMTSFSPVYTVGSQIVESIRLHRDVSKEEARQMAVEMLGHCGLPRAERVIDQYSWELSGGMCQRAMIARALVCRPNLLIADEPTTAVDVTTETQILDLMQRLQAEMGMAIMYITHNLGVIAEISQDVIVMYLGKIVEQADVRTVFYEPKHPYTQALLRSIPRIGRARRTKLDTIKGMVPDPYNIPPGCPFYPRCQHYMPGVCDVSVPPTVDLGDDHLISCYLYIQEQSSEPEKA